MAEMKKWSVVHRTLDTRSAFFLVGGVLFGIIVGASVVLFATRVSEPVPPVYAVATASPLALARGGQHVIAYDYDESTRATIGTVPSAWWGARSVPERGLWLCSILLAFPQTQHIVVADENRHVMLLRNVTPHTGCSR